MPTVDKYLGRGITFPVKLTQQGLPVYVGGKELIESSILMILSWPLNHRIFLSAFGTPLERLLEEPNDDLLQGVAAFYINDSLTKYEQRINILEVTVERTKPEAMDVTLRYRIKTSGFEGVMTFPFYLNKAA